LIESKTEKYIPIQETMKIVDIFPNQQIIYIYGNEIYNHLCCFKEMIEAYFSENQELYKWIEEERHFTIMDYLVKQNHILILNVTTNQDISWLVLYQDSISKEQKELLCTLLENSELPFFKIAIHNEDNRYGPYHYQETTVTPKILKKRRTISSLLI